MRKVEFWYDLETTGLSIDDGAAVAQIGYQIVENDVVKFEGKRYINPYSYPRPVTVAQEALNANGLKESDFDSYDTLEDVMCDIMHLLAVNYPSTKLTLIGYNNSSFDKYFLEEIFRLIGRPFQAYFNWKQIDVFEIVKFLQHIEFMGRTYNQKLATIARYLKVVPDDYDWHDAGNDIKATRLIYSKLKEALV